jgi:peptide/nickel transport system substrate-binding protein
MQGAEPISLYSADESDSDTLRACRQIVEPLLSLKIGGTDVEPALATSCNPNADLTAWTCKLREGVKFHDGSDLDAKAVVFNFSVLLDAANPLHKGHTGAFGVAATLLGLMNVPPR